MPPPSAELRLRGLLAEARWLESLARALVADPDEARDLVQEVWTTAAERAPAHVEHPRAWLATVLRNLVSVRRRARAASAVRELDRARSESLPGADDVVARAQVQRSLVDQVLALEEPWRSTVLLRFFDELSCEEIARRQQVPASTVRNRVAHALELLRARLSRVRGEEWMSALAPLALRGSWSAKGTAGASAVATTKAAAGLGTSGWIGGLLMASTLKIGVAVALAAGAVWWSWSAFIAPHENAMPLTSDGAVHEELAPVARDAGARATLPLDGEARASASTPPPASASASNNIAPTPAAEIPLPAGVIEGLVLDDEQPWLQGGHVELLPGWNDVFPAEPDATRVRTAPIDARGTFRFERLDPGDHMLRADLGSGLRVQLSVQGLAADAGRRVIVRVGSASLSGRAWDDDGAPRTGAQVSLGMAAGKVNEVDGLFTALTDAQGRYSIERLPADLARGILSQRIGEQHPYFMQHFNVTLKRGEKHTLDFGRPHGLPTWSGKIVTRSGVPIPFGAALFVRDPTGRDSLLTFETGDESFRMRLMPGSYRVGARLASHGLEELELGVFEVGDEDFVRDLVVPGTRLFGRVARADGPELNPPGNLQVSVRLEGHNYPGAVKGGSVARDGTYAIDGLAAGTYVLSLWPLALDGRDRVIIADSDLELRLDLLARNR